MRLLQLPTLPIVAGFRVCTGQEANLFACPPGDAATNEGDEACEEEAPERRPRVFSPRECARLQGFPEAFACGGCANESRFYHMIGNAVCPPVVAAVVREMLRAGVL